MKTILQGIKAAFYLKTESDARYFKKEDADKLIDEIEENVEELLGDFDPDTSSVDINFDGAEIGEANPVNADTLGGYTIEDIIEQAGGGSGEIWTLISDATLTEDVTQYTQTFDSMYRVFVVFDTPAISAGGKFTVMFNRQPSAQISNMSVYKTFASHSEVYMIRPPKTVLKNIENVENIDTCGVALFSSIAQSSSSYHIGNSYKDITRIDVHGGTVYAGTRIRIYGEAW